MRRGRGLFIVLEGPDKSGKSTQARLLVERLRGSGFKVAHTREPGGAAIAEKIRELVLSPRHRVHPVAELLLYEAARAQHTEETLRPALAAGKIVICERYTMSTTVYQGFARGLDPRLVASANRLATGGLRPALTFVFDLPEAEFERRGAARPLDRLEREPASFRRRVRAGYRRLRGPGIVSLDGRRPIAELQDEMLRRLRPCLVKILPCNDKAS
ncbi:MAG: dTMP kinase [Elusimicrobia bacterium]|nr:dTMP kinase [Elusimicrobiota bacterium]MDE2426461.1 dTMP kinase [Elusimicrobiota bacterium]